MQLSRGRRRSIDKVAVDALAGNRWHSAKRFVRSARHQSRRISVWARDKHAGTYSALPKKATVTPLRMAQAPACDAKCARNVSGLLVSCRVPRTLRHTHSIPLAEHQKKMK